MKAFIPVSLLALASAASACTFVYTHDPNAEYNKCSFDVFLKDDIDPHNNPGPRVNSFACRDDDCGELGGIGKANWELCMSGRNKDTGEVDGVTIKRKPDGQKVDVKHDGGGKKVENGFVSYWRGGIECPDAVEEPENPKLR